MVRAAKSKPAAEPEPTTPTVTQTRTRRTPKPNPKYEETPEVAEKSAEPKKSSAKKAGESSGKGKAAAAAKKTAAPAIKKQKLDLDDEETSSSKERPDSPPPANAKPAGRATRSGKADDSVKAADEPVEEKKPAATAAEPAADTNRSLRGRKRGASPAEEPAKKKKESESDKDTPARPSAITTRKSYLPASAKKPQPVAAAAASPEVKVEVKVEPKVEVKSPVAVALKAAAARTSLSSPKEADIKVEPKKQPLVKKMIISPQPTRQVVQPGVKSPVNVVTRIINAQPKPVPRILNTMISKDKQSPTIKLTGDGRDKKVFSIDLTDDSIKERKVISPAKPGAIKPSPHVRNSIISVKENVVRTPPADLLKNSLNSELNKMKASASLFKRNSVNLNHSSPVLNNSMASRRVTRFESWFVIDVKPTETKPFRHTHTFPLVRLGNAIGEVKLPSEKWEFKISLQKRAEPATEEDEVYNGDGADKSDYEPINILFKRNQIINNRTQIDRSLMIKPNLFTITMNGKQCKLVGAPSDITSLEDLEILLDIVDACDIQTNKCVELVTAEDVRANQS